MKLRKTLLACCVGTLTVASGPIGVQAQTVQLNMPTGGITGTYYMAAAPLADYINRNSDRLRVTPNTSGGGVENLRRVAQGQAQLGMTQAAPMFAAWHGDPPFQQPLRDWRVIGRVIPPMANHVITIAEEDIEEAGDLVGRSFAIGAPGSGAATSMMRFLEACGLAGEIDAQMLPHQDYPAMLMDGQIDAINRLGTPPSGTVEEISVQRDINLVDFGHLLEECNFVEQFPYYQPIVIEAGTYSAIDEDVTTFGNSGGFLIAHKDVPDDVVYEFTKLAYSDDAVRNVTMAVKGVDLDRENPLEGNIGPVHPGAARYWEEIGVEIPEPLLK